MRPISSRAGPWLALREAQNNLIIGVARRVAASPENSADPVARRPWFCVVEDAEKIVGVAMVTPPHYLLISEGPPGMEHIVLPLAQASGRQIPGVLGPTTSAAAFATAWARGTGQRATTHRAERIYQVLRVSPVTGVSGRMRQAAADTDEDLLTEWFADFAREIAEPTPLDARSVIRTGLTAGRFFLWHDPEPVCMAAWAGPTDHGIRIGAVFTPKQHRRRGYASALTAALSQRLLNEGRRFCFIFTDMANPTSNSIYQKIGYQAVCDCQEWRFEAR